MLIVGFSREDEMDEDVDVLDVVEFVVFEIMDVDGENFVVDCLLVLGFIIFIFIFKIQWKGIVNLDIIKV